MITRKHFLSGEPFFTPGDHRHDFRFEESRSSASIGSITSYYHIGGMSHECNVRRVDSKGASCYTVCAGKLINFRINFSEYTEIKPLRKTEQPESFIIKNN